MKQLATVVCIFSLSLTLFLGALDIVICITLYDTIGKVFNDYANVGWLMTGYNLPNALCMLLWGRIASLVGLKNSLVASIVIFEAGSLLAALATSMGMLIGGRVIAGFGGSGIETLVFAVGTRMVDEKHRARVVTILGIAYMLAEGAGPFIGGAFAEHVSWRWCFFINIPIGGVALAILCWGYNPAGRTPINALNHYWKSYRKCSWKKVFRLTSLTKVVKLFIYQLDIVGLLLSSGGFALIMLALTFGGNKFAWNSASIICMFTIGIALLGIFMLYDFVVLPYIGRKLENGEAMPLVPWSLACNMPILTSSMAGFFNSFAFELQSIYLVQYYQLVANEGPVFASIHLWQMSVPALITVIASAAINEKFGIVKPIIVTGVVFGFIGSGLLTLFGSNTSTGASIGYSMLAGASFGCVYQLSLLSSQLEVRKDDPEYHKNFIEVTAYNTFIKTMGFSFAGILSTTIFSVSLKNLASSHVGLPHFSTVEDIMDYRSQHYDGRNSPLGKIMAQSIRNVFYCALACSALSFIFGIFTSSKRTATSRDEQMQEMSENESLTPESKKEGII